MGEYSYGNVHYDYKLSIDISDLVAVIMDKLGAKDEDWELDDTNIVIYGSDKCRYKHWHCDATYYEPAEDETELLDTINEKDIDNAILNALDYFKEIIKTKSIYEIDIDEDNLEYELDEPDPDAAYDKWKDSLLEDL